MSKYLGVIGMVVGAVIGAALTWGSGAAYGAALGASIGGGLGGVASAFLAGGPAMPNINYGNTATEAPKPNDLQVMSYAEDAPVPYLYGTKLLAPQIMHIFDKWTKPVKQYREYQVQEVDADGKDMDVETHTRYQEVIVAYDYFIRGHLGLVQSMQGNVRVGEVYVNGKLNSNLNFVVKNGDEDGASDFWDDYNYDYPQRYPDLAYAEVDGTVGRNLFMLPSLQMAVTRLPADDKFDFLSSPLPENDNNPGCFLNIITTGLASFNDHEIWQLLDYYRDRWVPINSVTYNKWIFNYRYMPYDTNPESRVDFHASVMEIEEFVGKNNVRGFSFHVPWFWDLEDDVFRPMHAFEPVVVSDGFTQVEMVRLRHRPPTEDRVTYATGISNIGDGDQAVDYQTVFPAGTTEYNPTLGGQRLYNPTTYEPELKMVYRDSKGVPSFGGTPADDGIIQGIKWVIARGYEFIFYSFMEVADPPGEKPWRGNLLPSHRTIPQLLGDVQGQCEFYANLLVANDLKPRRFVCCSELVKINQHKTYGSPPRPDVSTYTDGTGTFYFTAVPCLMDIVDAVKAIFTAKGWTDVPVGYSADWSEVNGFKDDQGYWWRPLDDLFMLQDEVFIDAYYPCTEHHTLNYQDYYDGWTSGRDYDYYITNYDDWKQDNGGTAPITDRAYAAKDLSYWIGHNHYNYKPDGSIDSQTAWSPNSRKIYFCEFGCPSIDSGATEPNLFYDPYAVQGGQPKGTTLTVCNSVQYNYYRSFVANLVDGKLPVKEFAIWNVDTRPLFTLMGAGVQYWGDAYRIPVGHWLKYTARDPVTDIILNDFEARRGINLSIDTTSISAAFNELHNRGWNWNLFIDVPKKFSELLDVFSRQMPVLFFVDDGQLKARVIKDDEDYIFYNVSGFAVEITHDGTGYVLDYPFDHFIYDNQRWDVSGGYVQGWTYGAGVFHVDASNIMAESLSQEIINQSNVRATVSYFDSTNFQDRGYKTRTETYELEISSSLNWQDVRISQSLAPDRFIAKMIARYAAASLVFKRNILKFRTWIYKPVASRIRFISNLHDSHYRIVDVGLDDACSFSVSAHEEPQAFHDILAQQIKGVALPDWGSPADPVLSTLYFAPSIDRIYAMAKYVPDITWVLVDVTYNDGNKTNFAITRAASEPSLELDDSTMYRQDTGNIGFIITDQGELAGYARGIYGTYLLRGMDSTPIAASNNMLMLQSMPANEPVPEYGLAQTYNVHGKVIYGDSTSAEVYAGDGIAYDIGGKLYQRKDKWVVTPFMRGYGAGTLQAGQAPALNYDMLSIVVDGSPWDGVREVELAAKPSDVVIYYGDKYCVVDTA